MESVTVGVPSGEIVGGENEVQRQTHLNAASRDMGF